MSVESIEYILSLGKKVVWTLHDMAPFTGGCHYSNGCLGYSNDCSHCPQLASAVSHQPAEVLELKLAKWSKENLTVVSPSRWLANCAKQSKLFRNVDVRHIPNGLDTDVFVPTGKAHARTFFGLPQDKKILLFTCQSHGERRKGFKELLQVSKILAEKRSDLHIVTFGHASKELEALPIPYTSLGHIDEEWKLALGYSAADVTVLPSLEDNLPNVILESLACNTPVACFDSGGSGELIIDGISGRKVPTGDIQNLAQAIQDMLNEGGYKHCDEFSKRFLGLNIQSAAYIDSLGV